MNRVSASLTWVGVRTTQRGWSSLTDSSHFAIRARQSGVVCRRPASISRICRERLGDLPQLLGRVDDGLGLVVVVQEGEEPVVLLLGDRVVLVRMALGALDGQAEDALADGVHAVEHGLHAELLGVDAPFLVDHRVAEEAGGDDLVLRGARQLVAGDLLDDEPVVGQVAVQGVDHPVAVEPDEARLVLLVAVGVGVAGGVEPVPSPALAVVRRGQQAIDDPLVGISARYRPGRRPPPRPRAAGRSGRG